MEGIQQEKTSQFLIHTNILYVNQTGDPEAGDSAHGGHSTRKTSQFLIHTNILYVNQTGDPKAGDSAHGGHSTGKSNQFFIHAYTEAVSLDHKRVGEIPVL
jgi:hypothetical protein